MERWNSLPQIVRHIILGMGVFTLGAAFSFGYSYRPLHGALTFKVDSLEARLDERNREFLRVKDELAKLQNDESTRIEPETLSQIEGELAKTKSALRDAEKNAKRAESKRSDANANADRWRRRYESLRDQERAMPASAKPSPVAPPAAVTTPAEPEPATPSIPFLDPTSVPSPKNDDGALIPPEAHESDSSGSDTLILP
jgi:hypothetical protein